MKQKYLPHVIEPSLGVDRTFLAVLCSAYSVDEIEGEKRTVLRFHPRVAPIKAGIFPLVKNKPVLVERAQEIYKLMQRRWNVIYDQSGAIGRRYRGLMKLEALLESRLTLRQSREMERLPCATATPPIKNG